MRTKWGQALAGLAAAILIGGCGSSVTTVTEKASPSVEPSTRSTSAAPKVSQQTALDNLAQQPDPSVTAYCNEVPLGHPCHAVTATPSDPNESPQRNCDPQIVANRDTSCDFAENAFYEVYRSGEAASKSFSIEVYSPVTHKNYELGCQREGSLIGCTSSPLADGIYVSFPHGAVTAYTASQANAYASSRDVGDPPAPYADRASEASTSTPSSGNGGEENEPSTQDGPESTGQEEVESGSQDEVGSYSHAGDESFCEENQCIGNFQEEDGYVVECEDGSYSHAGGKSGACSDHGGEKE